MKKKVWLLSTAGIAAGLLYALESNHRKNASSKKTSGEPELSETSPSSGKNTSDSNGNVERGASMSPVDNGKTAIGQSEVEPDIDDQGTNQAEASHILTEIRDTAFEASNEKLALALGRPTEEIEQWTNGSGTIDGDVVMKARTLALQRGLEVE
jgi:hypothetical protein